MKYFVQNKVITFKGGSTVIDESGATVLKVAGKLFSPTHKKKIKTIDNKKLFTVRNKYWHILLHSEYIYDADGNKVVKISERLGFGIKVENYDNCFEVTRDGRSYAVYESGELLFTIKYQVNAKSLLFADCYEIEVPREENLPLATAFAIAFDNLYDRLFNRK